MFSHLLKFKQQTGQGLVEYALMLALVSVASVGALSYMGPQIGNIFCGVVDNLNLSAGNSNCDVSQTLSNSSGQSGSGISGGGGSSTATPTPVPTETPVPSDTVVVVSATRNQGNGKITVTATSNGGISTASLTLSINGQTFAMSPKTSQGYYEAKNLTGISGCPCTVTVTSSLGGSAQGQTN